jgi:hypothetical protein
MRSTQPRGGHVYVLDGEYVMYLDVIPRGVPRGFRTEK